MRQTTEERLSNSLTFMTIFFSPISLRDTSFFVINIKIIILNLNYLCISLHFPYNKLDSKLIKKVAISLIIDGIVISETLASSHYYLIALQNISVAIVFHS